ncbi:MAG: hypothetical protein ACW991_00715 [Candidatus Hodarchaeales archaeon]
MPTYTENISGSDVRALTGVPVSVASDEVIGGLLPFAAAQLNEDIQVKYKDVKVTSVDSYRENKIDGSNTTFFVSDDKKPIGDYLSTGVISGGAVRAYVVRSGGTDSSFQRVPIIVDSILDDEQGKFQLASAPLSSDQLFISWAHVPVELETPHPSVKVAICQLVAALAYTRVDAGKVSSFRVGKVRVMKQSEAFKKFMADYQATVTKILSEAVKVEDFESITPRNTVGLLNV